MLVLAADADGEDDDFLSFVIDGVIDQIPVTLRHELADNPHLLLPADMRKQNQALKRFKNWPAHAQCGWRVSFTDIGGDAGKVLCRPRSAALSNEARFTPAAQDLASIAAYIRERNRQPPLRVRAAILEFASEPGSVSAYRPAQQVEGVRKLVSAVTGIWSITPSMTKLRKSSSSPSSILPASTSIRTPDNGEHSTDRVFFGATMT